MDTAPQSEEGIVRLWISFRPRETDLFVVLLLLTVQMGLARVLPIYHFRAAGTSSSTVRGGAAAAGRGGEAAGRGGAALEPVCKALLLRRGFDTTD